MAKPRKFNQYRIEGDTAFLTVYYKDRKMECAVDLVDLPKLKEFGRGWYACPAKAPAGKFYVWATIKKPDGKRTSLSMHTYLMQPIPEGLEVHHKDNDGLNNRRSSNLEYCTHQYNIRQHQPGKDWTDLDAYLAHRKWTRIHNAAMRQARKALGVVQSTVYTAVKKKDKGSRVYAAYRKALAELQGVQDPIVMPIIQISLFGDMQSQQEQPQDLKIAS